MTLRPAPLTDTSALAANLAALRERIAAAGGADVRIVAVTKGFGARAWAAAHAVGLDEIGENYGQELLVKVAEHREGDAGFSLPAIHFLGAVQRRKVRLLAPYVTCWQGVARAAEGEEIARRCPGAAVMVEVNADGSPGRNGCSPGEVGPLVEKLQAMDLGVQGLMTVAPRPPDAARRVFQLVRGLADDLGLPERSMGMSQDLDLALSEGSTMIRVGEALFGDRPRPGVPGATQDPGPG